MPLRELLDPAKVERVLVALAIAGPLVGGVVGAVCYGRADRPWRAIVSGLLMGGLLTLVYGLWRLFNALSETWGLATVKNLALQLVLFALIGVAVGWAIARLNVPRQSP